MKIDALKAHPLRRRSDCLLIGVAEGRWRTAALRTLDRQCGGALAAAGRTGAFTGKAGQTLWLTPLEGVVPRRILLLGLGPVRERGIEQLRRGMGTVVAKLHKLRLSAFTVDLVSLAMPRVTDDALAQALTEAVLLADYRFDGFLTVGRDELPPRLTEMRLLLGEGQSSELVAAGVETAKKIYRGVSFARDLVNQPGNVKSPDYLALQARQMAREVGLECTILGPDELEQEGCGGILGVAQGSVREPRLILLEYRGAGDAAPIALVGKGVVFDTGGISIKPAQKMDEMKMDMGGAAAVLGTLCSAALLQLPVNLVGLVPAVENMPSGTAYRPGDILTTLSGKTVEVLNTDAEGRLILADALTWAGRYQPQLVIDLATLTGACIIALGNQAAAVLGNDEPLAQRLLRAGEASGERLWQLPLFPEYAEQIKSAVADVANVGGRPAGTITAAAFLQKFAGDYRWAHLDIAGTAWEEKGRPCHPKGGTGFGVRLLLEFLRQKGG